MVTDRQVIVSDPHACQIYHTKGQGAEYASVAEPPSMFMELARGILRSKESDVV